MQNDKLVFQEIEFLTPLYDLSISLRDKILRKPLGLEFDPLELEKEYNDFHLALLYNGDLAACLVMSPKENGEIKMRQVAVSEQHQSKGLGSILVRGSEVFCKEKGFEKIILNARDTAVKFYKRLDYIPVGESFIEVGIAHLKMYKSL